MWLKLLKYNKAWVFPRSYMLNKHSNLSNGDKLKSLWHCPVRPWESFLSADHTTKGGYDPVWSQVAPILHKRPTLWDDILLLPAA